jgi:hypothetical protein
MSVDDFRSDATVTLLIRLWRSAEEPVLRARLVEVRAGGTAIVAMAAGESGICVAVARWLSRCAVEADPDRPDAIRGG